MRFDAAELSGEVGATPTSDLRRSTGSHLSRAFAGAYRGDGECAGGFGVEFGALATECRISSERRSFSGDGAAAKLLRLWLRLRVEEGEREARATERVERHGGSGRRPDMVKPVGRGASTTPAYGRCWVF